MTLTHREIRRLCERAIERALFPPKREPRKDRSDIIAAREAMTQQLRDEVEGKA